MHSARIGAVVVFLASTIVACAVVFGVDQSQLKECNALPYARAVGNPRTGCAECAETRCCGLVGRCGQERPCSDKVEAYLRCVVPDGGRAAKDNEATAACAQLRPEGTALDTYTCVRDKCGVECGLAGCTLDVSVPRLGSATCDACYGAAACGELNACFKDRGCRTFVECLSHDPGCVGELARTNPGPACVDGGAEGAGGALPACAAACAGVDGGVGARCVARALFAKVGSGACAESCRAVVDAGSE